MGSFLFTRKLKSVRKAATRIMLAGVAAALFVYPIVGLHAADVTDPFRDELWYLDKISAPQAWDTETGSKEVIVAVLDAGFDMDHEELVNRYWVNYDEVEGDEIDNDSNGYEDDVIGWDFVDSDPDPSADISDPSNDTIISHGTVVSGIIAAEPENGLGIVGINWDVRVMPLRILNGTGSGTTSAVRRAVVYAVENGADVINLSLAFTQSDAQLRDTLEWAHDQGVVIVAAIGNGGVDTDTSPVYPACFDTETGRNVVIGVAATNAHDLKADFSNFGTDCVDLAAPGTNVFGASYKDSSSILLSTSYASPWQGTSMAAPMVSGAAAILKAAFPSLTPDKIRLSLKLSVDPVSETSLEARKRLGAGRLNVARALEVAAQYALGSSGHSSNTSYQLSNSFVVAEGSGFEPVVRRYDDHGEMHAEFLAYDTDFTGGVRLAVGDVNGDGVEEIVTGAGPGGGPQVRIFSLNGELIGQFFAFDEGGRTGIQVMAGDLTGDGVDEIVVVAEEGGTGQIRIFNQYGHLKGSFFPFDRTDAGLFVSIGDLDEDAESELVVSELSDQGSIRIFDGNGRYVSAVSDEQFAGGVTTAVGDLDQDGINELLVAGAKGHTPDVWVYNASGSQLSSHFLFPIAFTGGVQLVIGDIDLNGATEVFAVPKTSGGPQVRVFDRSLNVIGGFFAFDDQHRGGASIAIWNP